MSDGFDRFLLEDARQFNSTGRYVGLGAFGKHPGWDDHIEDLGLETESLNLAKSMLYVRGIGGQIDSGAWEKIDSAKLLPQFNHVFVWHRAGQALVGRLWSSCDGKGRKRYPMVLCLHFIGVPFSWALTRGVPALAELAEQCIKTPSADEVRGLVGRMRISMRTAVQAVEPQPDSVPLTPEAIHHILQPNGSSTPEGFFRVLYQLQGQLGKFAIGSFDPRSELAEIRPEQIRVPAVGDSSEQSIWFWTQFFLKQVDATVPLLLTLPLREGFLDITVGGPQSQEFFCLRASPKGVPLASEVPYSLNEEFRVKASEFFDDFRKNEPPKLQVRPGGNAASGSGTSSRTKTGWRRLLGG